MTRPPPQSTRTAALFPYTTLLRSPQEGSAPGAGSGHLEAGEGGRGGDVQRRYGAAEGDADHLVAALAGQTGEAGAFRSEHQRDRAIRGGEVPEAGGAVGVRSEEHTSELQSLMRISYAVFCLKKKKTKTQ